jgi:transcriptional regulator with XRE-family HTH domain
MGRSGLRQPRYAQEFGRRVRSHRQALGLTQEGLAERAGLHWTYVGSVERGERNLSLLNVLRLAKALKIDPADLVSGLRT